MGDLAQVQGPADRDHLEQQDAIRRLNDSFRRSFAGGTVVMTVGVRSLAAEDQQTVLDAVRTFDDFHPENDPYEEHDFGATEVGGTRYFWKIDTYDLDLRAASPDPADPAFTVRVMTIMRADEY